MNLKLLCFSTVRVALNQDSFTLDLPENISVAALKTHLLSQYQSELQTTSFRIAVNQEFVDDDHLLNEGDEIALIPPVQGG